MIDIRNKIIVHIFEIILIIDIQFKIRKTIHRKLTVVNQNI